MTQQPFSKLAASIKQRPREDRQVDLFARRGVQMSLIKATEHNDDSQRDDER